MFRGFITGTAVVAIAIMSPWPAPEADSRSDKTATFTIKGVIANVLDARSRQVIFGDANLQVALLRRGGGMPVTFDGKGRVGVALPDLPSTMMPENGSFSIECKSFKRGTYFVVVQPSSLPQQRIAFLLKNGQPLKIEVGKPDIPPVVDVGAVTIPVQ